MAERQGKERITTIRSPQSILHSPIITDHTRAAQLKSVLSLSALVLLFCLTVFKLSAFLPVSGSWSAMGACLPVGEELADAYDVL